MRLAEQEIFRSVYNRGPQRRCPLCGAKVAWPCRECTMKSLEKYCLRLMELRAPNWPVLQDILYTVVAAADGVVTAPVIAKRHREYYQSNRQAIDDLRRLVELDMLHNTQGRFSFHLPDA